MQYLHINKLEFPDEIKLIVRKQIFQMMDNITEKNQNKRGLNISGLDIFRTFDKDINFTSVIFNKSTDIHVKTEIIGKHRRCLMYLGEGNPKTMVVFMWHGFPSAKQGQSDLRNDNEMTKHTEKIDVYLCQVVTPTGANQLSDSSKRLLHVLKDEKTVNMVVTNHMNLLVRPAQGFTPTPTKITIEISNGEEIHVMKVCNRVSSKAREILRNVGVLPGQQCLIKTTITQNAHYSLQMRLHQGKLDLCLYEMGNILYHDADTEPLEPIAVLSTCCHRLDSVIEEICCLKSNETLDNNTDNQPGNKLHRVKVTGMMDVMKLLLKSSMIAEPVRSMGFDYDIEISEIITKNEIVKALCALDLMSDKKHEVRKFNDKYGAEIIKSVSSTLVIQDEGVVSVSGKRLPDGSNECKFAVDYRIRNLDALSHAIYHHNSSCLSHMHKHHGIDIQELSTAMYSGVAFCHSLKYMNAISTQNMLVINKTDFPGEFSDKIKTLIESDITDLSVSNGPWSCLRHNFHECTDASKRKGGGGVHTDTATGSVPVSIKFHITKNGLIFFKRDKEGDEKFVGAVYITPCIYRLHTNMVNSTHEKEQELTPSKEQKTTFNEIGKVIHQLHNENICSKQALMRNATMSLFFLNVICVNNFLHKDVSNTEHEMLRKAWLFSNIMKATKLCGGETSEEFYNISAHFANMASLPYASVGYWSTVPYV